MKTVRFTRWLRGLRSTFCHSRLATSVTVLVVAAATCPIVVGVVQYFSPVPQDRVLESSAMVLLSQMGDSLRAEIGQMVRPQIERTRKLAGDSALIAALRKGNIRAETEICNRAITQATEIDAFAVFDQTGKINAINTVYANGQPIAPERVARIMGINFGQKEIIQRCARNGATEQTLEFQTHCDITPAFFDSSGLSVAFSVPVTDLVTGQKLGLVSSRIRFDRLAGLIKSLALGGDSGSAEFVTDQGGYFSETINTGRKRPPVAVGVLSNFIAPLVQGTVDKIFCRDGDDYLSLFRVKEFNTVAGGGIQVMLIAKGDWLASEARQAKRLHASLLIGLGVLLLLAAAMVRTCFSLRQSQRWNRMLIDSAMSAVITTDDSGMIEAWNTAAETVFGYPNSQAVGRKLTDLIVSPGQSGASAKKHLPPSSGLPYESPAKGHFEVQLARADGAEITADLSVTMLKMAARCRFYVVVRDITAQKLMQSQLAQSQKLESIGQLAAGIAHEINTPAQYVGDNVRFLQEQFSNLLAVVTKYGEQVNPAAPPMPWAARCADIEATLEALDFDFVRDEVPKAIEQAIEGLQRVTSIVSAMKDFSHPGSANKEPADLNRSIASTVEVCRNRWKYVADLSMKLDPNLPAVPCLVAEFNQVLLNLVVNAADAIGEIVENYPSKKGQITVSTQWRAGRHGGIVEVRVSDNGPGIPEEAQKRIFEPFFTTKPVGKGTGQGLTLSRNVIVGRHGGELFFESVVGTGTTFVVRIPVASTGAEYTEAA